MKDAGQHGPETWRDILDSDERILWQGRPDDKVRWKRIYYLTRPMGLIFAGIAVAFMIGTAAQGGFAWMFGLIHFFVGLALAFGPPHYDAWRRRHTWYTLTDRRAFIATDLPLRGRRLKSYPIDKYTVLDYAAGDPATIHFAHRMRRTKNGTRREDIGFERIGNGAGVYALIRGVQRGRLPDQGARGR